jgi:transcription initiation factor TFIID subunit TAF12
MKTLIVHKQCQFGLKIAQVMQARQKQVQGGALPTHFQATATPVQQAMAMARTGGGLASPQQQQQQNQQRLTQQLQQQNPSRSSQPQQMAPSNVLFHISAALSYCVHLLWILLVK